MLHYKELSLVVVAVQITLRETPDQLLEVSGATMGGTPCAHFVVDTGRLSGRTLLDQVARHVGRHPSNVRCAMPDGSCVDYVGADAEVNVRACLIGAPGKGGSGTE